MAKGKQAKGEATPADSGPTAGAATPEAAVKALIAAAASGDMQKVGACFSAKAPGEFQSLIDGSCPPDQFKGFCSMFSNATVKGVELDRKNPARATVAVGLGEREESLTVVKEPDGWKVLDF